MRTHRQRRVQAWPWRWQLAPSTRLAWHPAPPVLLTLSACVAALPPVQDDDIPGIVRYRTYEVLKAETNNPRLR